MPSISPHARHQPTRDKEAQLGEKFGVAWKPDADAPDCSLCKQTFDFFVRRHHCRVNRNPGCSVLCGLTPLCHRDTAETARAIKPQPLSVAPVATAPPTRLLCAGNANDPNTVTPLLADLDGDSKQVRRCQSTALSISQTRDSPVS